MAFIITWKPKTFSSYTKHGHKLRFTNYLTIWY